MASASDTTGAGGGFVGRQRELAVLHGALDDVCGGSGRLILLGGEPGVGKTRLAEALAREARRRGANVVWGRCWADESAPELWPWSQAVRACLRAVDERGVRELAGNHGGELTALVAPLGTPSEGEVRSAASPATRFRRFNSVVHVLDVYAQRAPLVVVLEDLHQADEASLLLLEFFTQELRARPVLMVGTYREPGAAPNRALTQAIVETSREPGTVRLVLDAFDEVESAQLLHELLGAAPAGAIAAHLHRWAGGNPLFLTECARHWRGRADDRAVLPSVGAVAGLSDLLRETVEQRLAPLAAAERRVLACAAGLACEITNASVHDAAGPDAASEQIGAALAAAERLGLLARGSEAPGGYRFRHDLVRDVLAAEAPQPCPVTVPAAPEPRLPQSVAADVEQMFRREGEYWTVRFRGQTCRIRDAKGLAYVALLLRHPGQQLHVTELVGRGGAGASDAGASGVERPASIRRGLGDAGVVLDAQAKADYRRRLGDLERELDEAQSFHDRGRAERARQEIEQVRDELSAAVGLGGRDRRASSNAERARVNVTRSIARALEKMMESHPELARHLQRCIRTGTFCTYVPDKSALGDWVL